MHISKFPTNLNFVADEKHVEKAVLEIRSFSSQIHFQSTYLIMGVL